MPAGANRVRVAADVAAGRRLLRSAAVHWRWPPNPDSLEEFAQDVDAIIAAHRWRGYLSWLEIVKGRKVVQYNLLVKIAEGLGAPRGWLGMAYCDSATYAETRQPIGEVDDEDEAVKRLQT